ncbi:MAG: hypothetical protein BYD32DRAFT_420852 [Podila humilis]|nr:MAG: hypothetical protein BYD32DRAFT_420852 [Podila humilis]
MAHPRTASNIERATLKKTAVSTAPLWAEQPLHPSWTSIEEGHMDDDDQQLFSDIYHNEHEYLTLHSSNAYAQGQPSSAHASSSSSIPSVPSHIPRALSRASSSAHSATSAASTAWSVFATMSNVSASSTHLLLKDRDLPLSAITTRPHQHDHPSPSPPFPCSLSSLDSPNHTSPTIDTLCPSYQHTSSPLDNNTSNTLSTPLEHPLTHNRHHNNLHTERLSMKASSGRSKKPLDLIRGYPTGQCVSSAPPEATTWDEKDTLNDDPSPTRGLSFTNTAINLRNLKTFLLSSPMFSIIVKILIIVAAISLFAISFDAVLILANINKGPRWVISFTNDKAALIVTMVLSALTVAYSCFTIFLETRRSPAGIDSTKSKPLPVIFSEILVSIVWAQVLSVSIYIYMWTFRCGSEGDFEELWLNLEKESVDLIQSTASRLCRRQGAMVGLELFLVMLLIFNFYTHLRQNFKLFLLSLRGR